MEKIDFNVIVRLERLDEKFIRSANCCNQSKQLIDQNQSQKCKTDNQNNCQQISSSENLSGKRGLKRIQFSKEEK